MAKRFYVELQFDTNNDEITHQSVYDDISFVAYDSDGYRVTVDVTEEERG